MNASLEWTETNKLEVKKWRWEVDSLGKNFDYKDEEIDWYLERAGELIENIF